VREPSTELLLPLLLLLLLFHAPAGAKTGRCPRDKRVVREPSTEKDIWWASTSSGSPNYEMDERSFLLNRETAVSYLNSLHHVFVFDGYANWDPEARIKVNNRD
jgi:phosphoenolpyruvate carboxykinase (ATP)